MLWRIFTGVFNRQSGVFTVGRAGFDCSDTATLVFVTTTGQLIRRLNKLMIARIDFFFINFHMIMVF